MMAISEYDTLEVVGNVHDNLELIAMRADRTVCFRVNLRYANSSTKLIEARLRPNGRVLNAAWMPEMYETVIIFYEFRAKDEKLNCIKSIGEHEKCLLLDESDIINFSGNLEAKQFFIKNGEENTEFAFTVDDEF